MTPPPLTPLRIGLVGCVSQKVDWAAPAQDLYVSTLFRGRRRFVEKSCDQWFILSAAYGLVDKDTILSPYDMSLNGQGRAAKRAWSANVLERLRERLGPLGIHTYEVHAGANYVDFGLQAGLEREGATVVVPTRGLRQGEQLAFYKHHTDGQL